VGAEASRFDSLRSLKALSVPKGWLRVIGLPVRCQLQRRVFAKSLVIVEVFVAECDPEDALGQKVSLRVNNRIFVAGIGDTGVQSVDQAQASIDFSKQQRACVRSQAATGKIGLDILATQT
jgi:hypothetical protein